MNKNGDGLPADWPLADGKTGNRMIASVQGGPGDGKTDWALTAPGPIVFFEFDLNCEVPLKKYVDQGKKIFRRIFRVPNPYQKDVKTSAEEIFAKFNKEYYVAINSPEVRTVIWDTATAVYDAVRLAILGKIQNVRPEHYGPVKATMNALIGAATDSDTNLIMVHRMKDQWAEGDDGHGKPTGAKVRAGFPDIEFACGVMVSTVFDKEKKLFSITVDKCTQNQMLVNTTYKEQEGTNSFPFLAKDVYTGSKLEDWE